MHFTDNLWWIYLTLVILIAIFFLVFSILIKDRGK